MQCLLIDDDQDDQEVFMMILEKINRDINCLTANDGVEAISLLTSRQGFIPDYIFLDVNMPRMNGIECLQNIRTLDHLKNCKIFMYSTTSETSVVEQTKKLGVADFIVKPASPVALKETLAAILIN